MRFAITLNIEHRRRTQDAIDHNYLRYLEAFGITPLLIPNSLRDPRSYTYSLGIDGLLLTGGNDISAQFVEAGTTGEHDSLPKRDRIEAELLEMALDEGIPVLGICRGMQFINVFFGGLLQSLHSELPSSVNHVGEPHLNQIVLPLFARRLGGSNYIVNSFHKQGVSYDTLSPELNVFAICMEDSLIEGIFHPTRQIMGVQWHPEREGSSAERDARLLKCFLHKGFW